MYSVRIHTCTLLIVVKYYDLSVLCMSVMGFQNKIKIGWGVGGWGELQPSLFWIFGILLTLQAPDLMVSLTEARLVSANNASKF